MSQVQTRSYIDKTEAVATLRRCVGDLVSAVRTAENPLAIAVGSWTIRDVAVHLGDAFQVHRDIMRGAPVPVESVDQIADVNQRLIDASSEHDLGRLADRIEEIALPYADELGALGEDASVPWAGHDVPVTAVIAADVGECLVHGFDIAQAEGGTFPISARDAALTGRGVSPMTRHFVNPETTSDLAATVRLRLRNQWELDFIFDHGTLEIEEPNANRPDVHISADPAAFLLTGYGRIPVWKPMLKGQLTAWGRKPWLALRFTTLLKNP